MYTWNSYKCALRWDPSCPIECLNRSLKTIVLQSYGGRRTHVEFAKFFFIKRARVLEVMKFCFIGAYTTRWHQKQHRKLNINSRASRRAKFLFVDQCALPSRFWMDKCFSRKDPFKEAVIGDCVCIAVFHTSILPGDHVSSRYFFSSEETSGLLFTNLFLDQLMRLENTLHPITNLTFYFSIAISSGKRYASLL